MGDETSEIQPGFLFSPLRWTACWLLSAVERDPSLRPHLVNLTPRRMHLVALILAHRTDPWDDPNFVKLILSAPASEALHMTLGWQPKGLKGALTSLDPWVLGSDTYKALLILLGDPKMATRLSHSEYLGENSLLALRDLSPTLRRLVFDMRSSLLPGFADGLRLLANRGAFQSYEALVADLESVSGEKQLIAKCRTIVEDLPLPEVLPPLIIGKARRVDHPAEIRRLAKDWRNCLESFVWNVDCGTNAVYLWEDGVVRAIAMVQRRGRLGWFFEDAKGPNNCELPSTIRRAIRSTFAGSAIPPGRVAEAIEGVIAPRVQRNFEHHTRPPEADNDDWLDAG